METNLAALEAAVGHRFRDASLLNRALTHRSVASDRPQHMAPQANNEQLEFLGDAVLGMIVSETSKEAMTVRSTAIGMDRMNSPDPSGKNTSGRNASNKVAVQPITATEICFVATIAASFRW